MKKIRSISLLPLILFILNVNGQENQDFKKVQIGINFSPDYCYRTLKNNDGSQTSDAVIRSRKTYETAKLGFTTGLNACYNFTRKTGLEIGVQYSNKGFRSVRDNLTFLQPTPSDPVKAVLIDNFYYLDIPLKVNFTFGENKLRFCTSAGITTNILLNKSGTSIIEYRDGHKEKEKWTESPFYAYNELNISPTISAGVDIQLNERMHLKIEPTFRYGLLKIINTPVTAYLWNAGLNLEFYMGL